MPRAVCRPARRPSERLSCRYSLISFFVLMSCHGLFLFSPQLSRALPVLGKPDCSARPKHYSAGEGKRLLMDAAGAKSLSLENDSKGVVCFFCSSLSRPAPYDGKRRLAPQANSSLVTSLSRTDSHSEAKARLLCILASSTRQASLLYALFGRYSSIQKGDKGAIMHAAHARDKHHIAPPCVCLQGG